MKRKVRAYKRYPIEIQELINDKTFADWELYQKFKETCHSRRAKVKYNCIRCGVEQIRDFKSLQKRVLINTPLCGPCAVKEATNSEEWRYKNSQAQLKIQSTPEQKKKNADGVSKYWREHPETKERVRQKLLRLYQNKDFKDKWQESQKKFNLYALSGEILWRDKWLEFGSSYELCFAYQLESINIIKDISRCNFYIPYIYEGLSHRYYPDYIVTFTTGERWIYEIKSKILSTIFFDKDMGKKIESKQVAALEYIKENSFDGYLLADENWFEVNNLWLTRSRGIAHLCKRLYSENKLEIKSNRQRLAYLGIEYEDKADKKPEIFRAGSRYYSRK